MNQAISNYDYLFILCWKYRKNEIKEKEAVNGPILKNVNTLAGALNQCSAWIKPFKNILINLAFLTIYLSTPIPPRYFICNVLAFIIKRFARDCNV